jgi:hypothetical protein
MGRTLRVSGTLLRDLIVPGKEEGIKIYGKGPGENPFPELTGRYYETIVTRSSSA